MRRSWYLWQRWLVFILPSLCLIFLLQGCSPFTHESAGSLSINQVYGDQTALGTWDRYFVVPVARALDWLCFRLGNYGWAILVVPLIVRLILSPFVWKSEIAKVRMRKFQPELKKLREKHKGDRQGYALAQQEFYLREGISPLGSSGCLPLLLQAPVFFALFRITLTYAPLQEAEFFIWDLGKPDPYYILPLLSAGMMFLSQAVNLSVHGTGSMGGQEAAIPWKWILIISPVMTLIFALNFPTASVLYLLASPLLSMVQTLIFYQFYVLPRRRREQATGVSVVDVAGTPVIEKSTAGQRLQKKKIIKAQQSKKQARKKKR